MAKTLFPNTQNVLYTTQANHQGAVHIFSLVEKEEKGILKTLVQYSVLETNPAVPEDDLNWSDPMTVSLPKEIRPAGMSLLTSEEKDPMTQTAKAPLQAISDGQFLYLFRQSSRETLFVDRFVYDKTTKRIDNKWEVRYQRSRRKDVPEGKKDTLGWKDMEGEYFLEPTTELGIPVIDGQFTVVYLPTNQQDLAYWHLFTLNKDDASKVEVYSIRAAEDGLFANFQGQRS